jgi:hypothetical protein
VKGTNSWSGSGNVAGDVFYGRTGSGDPACNFKIVIEEAHKPLVYVRINVYGGFVDICQHRELKKGNYVVVGGELMNRKGREGTLVEVRCAKLVIEP